MQKEKQKILVTSALLYVNGLPHLGHMVGCLIPADVYSRAMRLMGNEVCYIAGTDEHGTPALVGAENENMPVQDYVDKYHAMHRAVYEGWGISYDFLGRTSAPQNHETTRTIAVQLYDNGYLQPRKIKALYSVDDKMFLPDRYVTGTCPHCGNENARGDQCEKCTRVLDPEDLINPRSAVSGSTNLQWRETTHLYLMLTKLAPKVAAWLKGKDWNKLTMGIANKWIDEGLQDRGITRDLKWGIPVPDSIPDMQDKVFYVWFDAPIGYISITRQKLPNDWEKWWLLSKGADKVKYVQFMGKDNVPFHSIIFPAQLLGASSDYKTVDVLKGSSFLNFEGGKFSKSAGRGVFAQDALAEMPADYWRWHLMKNAPETDDADFTFQRFADDINKDLNDVLGNFVLRVLKFYNGKFGNKIIHQQIDDQQFNARFDQMLDEYKNNLHDAEFRRGFAVLRQIWVTGNEYIDAKSPWSMYKTDPDQAGRILVMMINFMGKILKLSLPVIPDTATRLLGNLGLCADWNMDEKVDVFTIPESVFQKVTDQQIAGWMEKYKAK